MLTLHLSRIPDLAAESLHESAIRSYKKGRNVYLLVPNQFTVEAEQAMMDTMGEDVLFNLQVKTFQALEKEIFLKGQGYRRPVLSDLTRRMLLRLLLEDSEENWQIFQKEVRGKSFLSLLSDQLREFKEYGLSPSKLREMGEMLGGTSQIKLEETAHLIDLYEDLISDRFEDTDGRMLMAFEQKNALSSFKDTDFFFDYFHSFSDIEMAALGSLLEVTDCELSLVLDPEIGKRLLDRDPKASIDLVLADIDAKVPDASAFSLSMRFFNRLLEETRLRNVPLKIVEAQGKSIPDPALVHAATNLFSYAPKNRIFKNPPIEAYLCRNSQEELDKAIIEINRLIRKGVRFRDIQLIYMDAEEYIPILKKKFEEEEFPYFLDEARSVQHHPLIRAIESALEIVWKGPSKDRYFRLLKTGMLGLDKKEVDIYQNYVLANQLDYRRLDDDFYFTFDEEMAKNHPREYPRWKQETETAQKVKKRLETTLQPLLSLSGKKGSILSYASALVRTLLKENVQSSLKSYEEKLKKEGKREEWESHRQLWDKLMELLDQLVQVAGKKEISFESFAKTIQEGLENLELGIIPPYQDQILCSGLHRTRARTRPYVFMLGMNDLYLPKARNEASLFSKEEKAFFQSQGYYLPSMAQVQEEEERLNFYSAILKVGKKLYLFSSQQNLSNEAMEASFWLKSILSHIYLDEGRPMALKEISSFSQDDLLYSRNLRQLYWPEEVREKEKNGEKDIPQIHWIESLGKDPVRKEGQWMLKALKYQNIRAPLSSFLCSQLFQKEATISASILEDFAACPYRAFVNGVLRPEEERLLTYDALDNGNLFHQSLDRWAEYVEDHLEHHQELHYEESRKFMQEALLDQEKKIFNKISREDPKNSFLLSLAAKTLDENHQQGFFQIENAKMLSMDHELSFGPGKSIPSYPLLSSETGEKFYLEGFIDRIDWIGELDPSGKVIGTPYIRIIDYKTGRRSFDFKRLVAGLDLQLSLYLKAVSSYGQAIGFFYMPIHPSEKVDLAKKEKEAEEEKPLPLVGQSLLDGILLKDEKAVRDSDFSYLWSDQSQQSLIYNHGAKMAPIKIDSEGKQSKGKAGPLDRERILDEKDFTYLLNRTAALAGNFAGRRAHGEISPRPCRIGDSRVCSYCPYSSLCRFESRNQFKFYRMVEPIKIRDWRKARLENDNDQEKEDENSEGGTLS